MYELCIMEMKIKKLQRDIIRLSVPAVVSNVTVPLLGLCDTAISGHLGDAVYLGAIAVGAMMFNVTFWLFGFLRMGTSGLTANAFGAGDRQEQSRVLARAMIAGLAIGLLIVFLQKPLANLLIAAIFPTPDVRNYAMMYFRICVWGSPALLATMSVNGWFVGMQSTFWPMAVAIVTNIVNIALSFTLAFGLDYGFTGVAYGTLAANWTGLILALGAVIFFSRRRLSVPRLRDVLKGRKMMKFFSVNTDLFFRSACVMGVSLAVTGVGAGYGAVVLGANAVVMQFFQMFSYFMDGYAFTGEALVGRYSGAVDRRMLGASVRSLILWTFGLVALFTVVYGFGWRPVACILTDVPSVIEELEPLAVYIILIPAVSAWAFVFDGFYIGMTSTRKMLVATAVATTVFFIAAFVRFSGGSISVSTPEIGMLWISFLTYLLARGVLLACMWPSTVGSRMPASGKLTT